jgi:predicted ester cyclase
MSSQLTRKLARATADMLEHGQYETVAEHFSPGYAVHYADSASAAGQKAITDSVEMLRMAFPDLSVEVEFLVEASDRVAWLRTLRGSQQGRYRGFPASHREISWREMVVSRFEDGFIAEEWVVSDLAEKLLLSRKG